MTDDNLRLAIEKARALPCWTAPSMPEPLGGGITNINLKLIDQGRAFVVRLGADIAEHGVMRFNERAISKAAHAAGLSPAVHYAEPGALVLDYVDAAPLTDAEIRTPAILVDVVGLLRRVHRDVAAHLRGPVLTFWVFHVLRDYAATLRELGSAQTAKLPALMEDAKMLEAAIGPIDLVLGHNDLLPANILRGDDRLWVIDWEYGGFSSALFDLGGLATNNGLSEEAETLMLTTYYGAPPDTDLMRRYTAMKCASLLRETMWSMVSELTSEIDFDYGAYTDENLSRYQRAVSEFKSSKDMS